jgi:hypothetical protein
MDPIRHPRPRVFDPSRYEADLQTAAESASNSDPSKRDHFGFGAGRRICQGMHIAEKTLFLAISRLLWAFNFEKARDEAGMEITPDIDDIHMGAAVCPAPFPAKITPRSNMHSNVIRQEWARAQDLLDVNGQWKNAPKSAIFTTHSPVEEKSGNM